MSTQAWHKKLIGYLLAYFSVLYLIAALVAYFKYFNNPAWRDFTSQIQLLTPFIVAPFILIFLKRFLTWWYHRKIKRNEIQLEALKKQKAKILDEVMETETYKVAKELLDEFATDAEKRALNLIKSPELNTTNLRSKSMLEPSKMLPRHNVSGMEVRKRQLDSPAAPVAKSVALGSSFIQPNKPESPLKQRLQNVPISRPATNTPIHSSAFSKGPPGPPLPRPVLPRERGYMDRVVEYLVGDGPHNRYALICRQCQSHNGMALREEFEYIAYRCCYCHYWNPARKQRPTAPKLETASTSRSSQPESSSSSDEEQESRRPSKDESHSTKELESTTATTSSDKDDNEDPKIDEKEGGIPQKEPETTTTTTTPSDTEVLDGDLKQNDN